MFNIPLKYYDFAWTVKEKWTFQDFSNINALGIKFGLAVKTQIHNLCKPGRANTPMLDTKSKGHWPFGSRQEDI